MWPGELDAVRCVELPDESWCVFGGARGNSAPDLTINDAACCVPDAVFLGGLSFQTSEGELGGPAQVFCGGLALFP